MVSRGCPVSWPPVAECPVLVLTAETGLSVVLVDRQGGPVLSP